MCNYCAFVLDVLYKQFDVQLIIKIHKYNKVKIFNVGDICARNILEAKS